MYLKNIMISMGVFAFASASALGANSLADYPELERYVEGSQLPASLPPLQYTPD